MLNSKTNTEDFILSHVSRLAQLGAYLCGVRVPHTYIYPKYIYYSCMMYYESIAMLCSMMMDDDTYEMKE